MPFSVQMLSKHYFCFLYRRGKAETGYATVFSCFSYYLNANIMLSILV